MGSTPYANWYTSFSKGLALYNGQSSVLKTDTGAESPLGVNYGIESTVPTKGVKWLGVPLTIKKNKLMAPQ